MLQWWALGNGPTSVFPVLPVVKCSGGSEEYPKAIVRSSEPSALSRESLRMTHHGARTPSEQ